MIPPVRQGAAERLTEYAGTLGLRGHVIREEGGYSWLPSRGARSDLGGTEREAERQLRRLALARRDRLEERLPYAGAAWNPPGSGDESARLLERQAATGDPEAAAAVARDRVRRGSTDPRDAAWAVGIGDRLFVTFEGGRKIPLDVVGVRPYSGPLWELELTTSNPRAKSFLNGMGAVYLEHVGPIRLPNGRTALQEGRVLATHAMKDPVRRVTAIEIVHPEADLKPTRSKPSGPRPIRLGTKRSRKLFEQATRAIAFSLDNNFSGQDLDLAWVRGDFEAWLRKHRNSKSVAPEGGGRYIAHVHSNLWYLIWSPAEEPVEPDRSGRSPFVATNPPSRRAQQLAHEAAWRAPAPHGCLGCALEQEGVGPAGRCQQHRRNYRGYCDVCGAQVYDGDRVFRSHDGLDTACGSCADERGLPTEALRSRGQNPPHRRIPGKRGRKRSPEWERYKAGTRPTGQVQRARKKHKTEAAAWADVRKQLPGIRKTEVVPAHTKRFWRWIWAPGGQGAAKRRASRRVATNPALVPFAFVGNPPGVPEQIDLEEALRSPGAAEALRAYRRFHGGADPEGAAIIETPGPDEVRVVVGLGYSPETSYFLDEAWGESNKAGPLWVHDHPEGKEPILALDPETKVFLKLPTHKRMRATDWLRE